MAIVLEKVVQGFYDRLEEGKICGRKCPKCGAVEFPPVYACNSCGILKQNGMRFQEMQKCIQL